MSLMHVLEFKFYFFIFAESGKMLDDALRHGLHDLYWCYIFERSVSSYKSIKTNQKHSEITYSKYESHLAFTNVQERISQNKHHLYPPQRAILEIHKQLLTKTLNVCFVGSYGALSKKE